jgi:hypothetical protein
MSLTDYTHSQGFYQTGFTFDCNELQWGSRKTALILAKAPLFYWGRSSFKPYGVGVLYHDGDL